MRLVATLWRFSAGRLALVAAAAGVVLLLALPGWTGTVRAQEEPAREQPAQEEPAAAQPSAVDEQGQGTAASEGGELETSDTDLDTIQDLLEQDESVLSGPETYSYDPGTRRDPFRSLLETRNSLAEETRERPEGKAGLLIDEIELEGVFELADGPVAQVQSAREETAYLLRPGDQLWDGDVISITLEEVVFKQVVNDPTALRPFREVVKRLNPVNP